MSPRWPLRTGSMWLCVPFPGARKTSLCPSWGQEGFPTVDVPRKGCECVVRRPLSMNVKELFSQVIVVAAASLSKSPAEIGERIFDTCSPFPAQRGPYFHCASSNPNVHVLDQLDWASLREDGVWKMHILENFRSGNGRTRLHKVSINRACSSTMFQN